jgi:hypothetical protein
MKFPENVRKALNALPQSKRDRVQAIVRRHVNACRRMGVELEFMDRVWLEAIEAVENEERFDEPFESESRSAASKRRSSPRTARA